MRSVRSAVALGLAFWAFHFSFAGGAGTVQLGDYRAKGFLSDYSRLKSVEGRTVWRYIDPGVDFSRYDKVMLDRIKIFLKEDADYKGIDPQELHELVTYFHRSIARALGDRYPVVSQPGPGVLRLRIALTDLVPNRPEASVVSLVVPYLWLGEAGAGVAEGEAGSTPFIGEASIEVEALDSQTARQLGAYVERHVGKKYNWSEGVDTAVADYLKAYSTWAYTRQAMDEWAYRIRVWLDRTHGVEPPPRTVEQEGDGGGMEVLDQ